MTLRIEARLKSGAIVIAAHDPWDGHMGVNVIKNNAAMIVILVNKACERGLLSVESGAPINESHVTSLYPLLRVTASNLNGLKSGHGMALWLMSTLEGEPVWKDTVKSLSVSVVPVV